MQLLVALIGLVTLLLSVYGNDTIGYQAHPRLFDSQSDWLHVSGAWSRSLSAAIFHLMTHAFFKALLFLASGTVILSLHHEQNIFKMGGLRKALPVSFLFLIGSRL